MEYLTAVYAEVVQLMADVLAAAMLTQPLPIALKQIELQGWWLALPKFVHAETLTLLLSLLQHVLFG